jgi:hypothetical protein
MLEIQKYFKTSFSSLEEKLIYLKDGLNLNIKIQDNKILLNYRIDSPKDSTIVNECRGLILDKDTFDIICYPFNRFYNYGEGYAAKIDWNFAEIYTKLDGTLCNLYHDSFNNKWQVSTRNMIYAEGVINENPILKTKERSFAQLFWEIFFEKNYNINSFNKYFTYCFELCSLENKVVKKYDERNLSLLTVRNNISQLEFSQSLIDYFSEQNNILRPQKYKISTLTLESVQELFKDLQADDEGFVVCDKFNNRIKVKNPEYFALSAIKNNGNIEKNIIRFVINGEREEFISYFPEYTEIYDNLLFKYNDLSYSAIKLYQEHKDKESQKEFALSILSHPLNSLLFQLRAKKYNSLGEAIENNLEFMEKVLLTN